MEPLEAKSQCDTPEELIQGQGSVNYDGRFDVPEDFKQEDIKEKAELMCNIEQRITTDVDDANKRICFYKYLPVNPPTRLDEKGQEIPFPWIDPPGLEQQK